MRPSRRTKPRQNREDGDRSHALSSSSLPLSYSDSLFSVSRHTRVSVFVAAVRGSDRVMETTIECFVLPFLSSPSFFSFFPLLSVSFSAAVCPLSSVLKDWKFYILLRLPHAIFFCLLVVNTGARAHAHTRTHGRLV